MKAALTVGLLVFCAAMGIGNSAEAMDQVSYLIVGRPTVMTSPMEVTLQQPDNPSTFKQTKLTIASGSTFSGSYGKGMQVGSFVVPGAEFTNLVNALNTVPPDQLPLTVFGNLNGNTFTVTGWSLGTPIHH